MHENYNRNKECGTFRGFTLTLGLLLQLIPTVKATKTVHKATATRRPKLADLIPNVQTPTFQQQQQQHVDVLDTPRSVLRKE